MADSIINCSYFIYGERAMENPKVNIFNRIYTNKVDFSSIMAICTAKSQNIFYQYGRDFSKKEEYYSKMVEKVPGIRRSSCDGTASKS